MADLPTFEDEAPRYVLGELDAAERCEFEAQLAQSAELRARVRELEEGLEAGAMACPPQRPPAELWQRIDQAVAGTSREEVVVAPEFRTSWLPHAWAAAACVVGALMLGVWLTRPPSGSSLTKAEISKPTAKLESADSIPSTNAHGTIIVRQTVWEPQEGVTNLAPAPRRGPTLDSASRAIQFFGAVSTNSPASTLTQAPSADVQRALFAAMARELGWQSGRGSESDGVDFVDLRPPGWAPSGLPAPMVTTTGSLVGFVSGDSLFLAFGSNTVPRARELQFWVGESDQDEKLLGTATLGNDPLVMVIPAGALSPNTWMLTVIGVSSSGISNVVGQIFIFAPPP